MWAQVPVDLKLEAATLTVERRFLVWPSVESLLWLEDGEWVLFSEVCALADGGIKVSITELEVVAVA